MYHLFQGHTKKLINHRFYESVSGHVGIYTTIKTVFKLHFSIIFKAFSCFLIQLERLFLIRKISSKISFNFFLTYFIVDLALNYVSIGSGYWGASHNALSISFPSLFFYTPLLFNHCRVFTLQYNYCCESVLYR